MSMTSTRNPGMMDVVRALGQPRVALITAEGFSSGLPFFLTAATLGYWLRDEGTSLKAIGFISWVGLAYSFKFLWSPIVDRIPLPVLGMLGRRRGWMLLTQVVLMLGLFGMAATGPKAGLGVIGIAALIVAFTSATQDIAVDAFRIEWANNPDELGLFTSAFQLGYRVAVLISDAVILFAAQHLGWPIAYALMALLMGVGIFATLRVSEPMQADRIIQAKAPLWTPRGFADGVGGPFVSFFSRFGLMAAVMLLFIALYRLPEYVVGPMATPYYHDLGLAKDTVGAIRSSFGLVFSLIGISLGGLMALRLGYMTTLIIGGIFQALAEGSFALLAFHPGSTFWFAFVMSFDNFGIALAGVALVTYMSSLTTLGYTATQYALFTSAFAFLGKVFKGFSGAIVEGLQHQGHTLMQSYAIFFVGAGLIGLPSILLAVWMATLKPKPQPSVSSAPSS